MSNTLKQHTLNIFKHLHDKLPMVAPKDVHAYVKARFDEALADGELTLEELEDIMVDVGKRAYPYIQAFEEMYALYEEELADKLLVQRASHPVRKKYELFKEMGGSFQDLYRGEVHHMFGHDERNELTELLIDLKAHIRKHATQAILSHKQDEYNERVEKYGKMIEETNQLLDELHNFAQDVEYEHIKEDIFDKIKTVNHSFAFLAPKVSIIEIRDLRPYYEGKIFELKKH